MNPNPDKFTPTGNLWHGGAGDPVVQEFLDENGARWWGFTAHCDDGTNIFVFGANKHVGDGWRFGNRNPWKEKHFPS